MHVEVWAPVGFAVLTLAADVEFHLQGGLSDDVSCGVFAVNGFPATSWAGCGDELLGLRFQQVGDGFTPGVDGAGHVGDVVGVLGAPPVVGQHDQAAWGGHVVGAAAPLLDLAVDVVAELHGINPQRGQGFGGGSGVPLAAGGFGLELLVQAGGGVLLVVER